MKAVIKAVEVEVEVEVVIGISTTINMRKLKTIDDNEKKRQYQRKVSRSEDKRRISKTGDECRVFVTEYSSHDS